MASSGLVSAENAELYSSRKAIVQRGIDRIKQTRGEKTTEIEGLAMDITKPTAKKR